MNMYIKYINFIRGEISIRKEYYYNFGVWFCGNYKDCKFSFHIYFFKYSFDFHMFYTNKIFNDLIYWHSLRIKNDTNEKFKR